MTILTHNNGFAQGSNVLGGCGTLNHVQRNLIKEREAELSAWRRSLPRKPSKRPRKDDGFQQYTPAQHPLYPETRGY